MKKLIAITTLATLFLASGTAMAGGGGHHSSKHDSQFIIYIGPHYVPAPTHHFVHPPYKHHKRVVHKKKYYNSQRRHGDRNRHNNKSWKHDNRHHR